MGSEMRLGLCFFILVPFNLDVKEARELRMEIKDGNLNLGFLIAVAMMSPFLVVSIRHFIKQDRVTCPLYASRHLLIPFICLC